MKSCTHVWEKDQIIITPLREIVRPSFRPSLVIGVDLRRDIVFSITSPQNGQNFALSGISEPHLGQNI